MWSSKYLPIAIGHWLWNSQSIINVIHFYVTLLSGFFISFLVGMCKIIELSILVYLFSRYFIICLLFITCYLYMCKLICKLITCQTNAIFKFLYSIRQENMPQSDENLFILHIPVGKLHLHWDHHFTCVYCCQCLWLWHYKDVMSLGDYLYHWLSLWIVANINIADQLPLKWLGCSEWEIKSSQCD